jgi:hypothetical protein
MSVLFENDQRSVSIVLSHQPTAEELRKKLHYLYLLEEAHALVQKIQYGGIGYQIEAAGTFCRLLTKELDKDINLPLPLIQLCCGLAFTAPLPFAVQANLERDFTRTVPNLLRRLKEEIETRKSEIAAISPPTSPNPVWRWMTKKRTAILIAAPVTVLSGLCAYVYFLLYNNW